MSADWATWRPLSNPTNAPRGWRLPRLAQGKGMMGDDAKRDEGNLGTEYKADVQRFFALTRGHVVIAGPRTSRFQIGLALKGHW
jgi:hypothetical protein